MAKRAVIIDITTDPSGFRKGSKQAGDAADTLAGKVENVGKAIALAYTAKKVVDFGYKAVQAAADVVEAQNKTNVVFESSAASILAWAKEADHSLGLSEQAALDAAATFGIFGKSAGKSGQDLADFSTQMAGLAGDLASFHNTSPEDAILAIGAALRGESEPIRRYGVLLNDAALKARAMEMKIYDGTGALTAQQKVLAAQAEILAQTTDAQGDFARTSDSVANQQRILSAQWQNMQAQIGAQLIPAFSQLLGVVGGAFEWFGNLSEGSQKLLITLGLLAGGLYVTVAGVNAMRAALISMGVSANAVNPILLGVAAAVTAAVAVMEIFSGEEDAATEASNRFLDSTRAAAASLDLQQVALLDAAAAAAEYGDQLFGDVDEQTRDLIRGNKAVQASMEALGIKMEDVVAAGRDEVAANQLRQKALDAIRKRKDELTAAYARGEIATEAELRQMRDFNADPIIQQHMALAEVLGTSAAATARSTEELLRLSELGDATSAAILKLSPAFDELTEAQQRMVEATIDHEVATDADLAMHLEWQRSMEDATDIVDDGAGAVRTYAKRIRDLSDEFRGLLGLLDRRDSIRDMEQGFDDLRVAADEAFYAAADGAENAEEKQRDAAQAVDDMKRKVIEFAEKVGDIPAESVTEVLALIDEGKYEEAEAKLRALEKERQIRFSAVLDPATDQITIGSLGKVKLMARGGSLGPGEFGIVGETGMPEIVETPTLVRGPARVTGVRDTARLLRGSGASAPSPVTVNMHNGPSPAEVAREITWLWRVAQ